MIRLRNLPDLIGALLFMALGIIVTLEAFRLKKYASMAFVGDHTLPLVLGSVFVVLGAVLLGQSFHVRQQRKKGAAEEAFPGASGERTRLLLCLAALFLYVWMLGALGYAPATWLASVVLFRLIGSYQWLTSLFFSALLTGCLYVLFICWLQITFPG